MKGLSTGIVWYVVSDFALFKIGMSPPTHMHITFLEMLLMNATLLL